MIVVLLSSMICTLWLALVFLVVCQVVLGKFRQQVWYLPFLLVFAKWPIDWGYNKLMIIEAVGNNMWLSLYYPVVWTGIICFGLKFCISKSNIEFKVLT